MALVSRRLDSKLSLEPWHNACHRFLEGLSEEQARIFKSATLANSSPEDLVNDTSEAHSKYYTKSKWIKFHNKMRPFTEFLVNYGTTMDVYANASSLYLCPIWGSVKVLVQVRLKLLMQKHQATSLIGSPFLNVSVSQEPTSNLKQMSQNHTKKFDKLTEIFQWVGDTLPRLEVYQYLHGEHLPLVHILTNIYVTVLDICTRLKAELANSGTFRGTFGLLHMSRKRYEDQLQILQQYSHQVEIECNIADRLENRRRQQRKMLDKICALDPLRKHRTVEAVRLDGTGLWLFEVQAFKDWLYQPQSGELALEGITGSGKTVLVSHLLDFLTRRAVGHETGLCYHYCDYADAISLDLAVICRSLVKQLLCSKSASPAECSPVSSLIEEGSTSNNLSDSTTILPLLVKITAEFRKIFIVIDGLDELLESDQAGLLEFLGTLSRSSQSVVKVFVSCRQVRGPVINRLCLTASLPVISIDSTCVQNDIRFYITRSVEEKLAAKELTISDPNLKELIIGKLTKGAKDMFLWATLQILEICEAVSDYDIRNALDNLPADLASTFDRIIQRISGTLGGPTKLNIAKRVFSWLLAARRPLRLCELAEAVSLSPGDKLLDRGKLPAPEKLIKCCGSLVRVHKAFDTVTFIHHAVQQYVQSPRSLNGNPSTVTVDRASVETYAAEVCLTYLMMSEVQGILTKPTKVALTPAMVERFCPRQGAFASTASRVMRHRSGLTTRRTQQEFNLNPQRLVRQPWVEIKGSSKFEFLGYASTFWLAHSSHLEMNSMVWSHFERIVRDNQLLQVFTPWLDRGSGLLNWAIENNHLGLLRWARQQKGLIGRLYSDNGDPILTKGIKDVDMDVIDFILNSAVEAAVEEAVKGGLLTERSKSTKPSYNLMRRDDDSILCLNSKLADLLTRVRDTRGTFDTLLKLIGRFNDMKELKLDKNALKDKAVANELMRAIKTFSAIDDLRPILDILVMLMGTKTFDIVMDRLPEFSEPLDYHEFMEELCRVACLVPFDSERYYILQNAGYQRRDLWKNKTSTLNTKRLPVKCDKPLELRTAEFRDSREQFCATSDILVHTDIEVSAEVRRPDRSEVIRTNRGVIGATWN